MIARREHADSLVQAAKSMDNTAEDVLPFECDDWVIVRGQLASVKRFGHAVYEGQARILWSNESVHEWTAGQWVPYTEITALSFPAVFRAAREILSADEPPILIVRGEAGTLCTFDKDGDLIVQLDTRSGKHCIFQADAIGLVFK